MRGRVKSVEIVQHGRVGLLIVVVVVVVVVGGGAAGERPSTRAVWITGMW